MTQNRTPDHSPTKHFELHKDIFDVSGKVIVITGGLGRLGFMFASELAARDARVVLLDVIYPTPCHASLISGDNVLHIRGDVTDRASLEQALGTIRAEWGPPFGLINNAALDSPPNSNADANPRFENFSSAMWDKTMDVNVKGVLHCCQVFGKAMSEAGRGSIVNICSTYGLLSPDQRMYEYRRREGDEFYKPVSYTASKSALVGMGKYIATYWAAEGVRTNTLTLGGVFNGQDPRFLKEYARRTPLGRMAEADEYNGAVVFLMSDASRYMTGSNLVIDGGWTAW